MRCAFLEPMKAVVFVCFVLKKELHPYQHLTEGNSAVT